MPPPRKTTGPCETRKALLKWLDELGVTTEQLIARMAVEAQQLRPVGDTPSPPAAKDFAGLMSRLLGCELIVAPAEWDLIEYLFDICLGKKATDEIIMAMGLDVVRADPQAGRFRIGRRHPRGSSS